MKGRKILKIKITGKFPTNYIVFCFQKRKPNQFSNSPLHLMLNILRIQKEMLSTLAFFKSEENYYYTFSTTISTSEKNPYVNLSSRTLNAFFPKQQYCEQKIGFPVGPSKTKSSHDGDVQNASALRWEDPRNLWNTVHLPLSWDNYFESHVIAGIQPLYKKNSIWKDNNAPYLIA